MKTGDQEPREVTIREAGAGSPGCCRQREHSCHGDRVTAHSTLDIDLRGET